MRKFKLSCLCLSIIAFVLCFVVVGDNTRRASAQNDSAVFLDSSSLPTPGDSHSFDVANMDRSAAACQNFFQYANGGWTKSNPVPAAYSRWGRFDELAEKNRDVVHQILEDAAKNRSAAKGSNEQKIRDYYAACMDEARVEADGVKPIQSELDRISKIKDQQTLQADVAHLHGIGVPVLFRFGSGQDFKDATQVIGQLNQGGLGLPDRDYYLNPDEKSKTIRAKYVAHVTRMFQLLGDDATAAGNEANAVMSIETKLAEASMKREDLRVPEARYHKMKVADLKALAPDFGWDSYFKGVRVNLADLNVGMPDFVKAESKLLTTTSLDDWKTYLRWHLVNARATALPKTFVDEDFDFKGRTLTGAQELLPRWKRCVQSSDQALGEAIGPMYVRRQFPPEAKARAVAMVQNLIAALHDDLQTLSWMSETTRQRATAKLEAFMRKIGYPDKWRDYSTVRIDRQSYAGNIDRVSSFEVHRQWAKIARPVDRTEWGMTPPTVNAYYNPSMNEIVFPAGILQWPFFDAQADDAINYGGIGVVIGHEMTHGFDDSGAKFDPQGNLKNWWTDDDLQKFKARAQCIIDQFDSYEVQPGLHEKGKLVTGESIADLGGLAIAYAAFQKSMQGKPRPPDIDGFTPQQRFFLGYAQIWAQNVRPEFERQLVVIDSHPLGRFRVNGPLSNMPLFAQAFQCKDGDAMVRPPDKRCQIW
ncbi:MAG TPA: M13 family metallopeptidase [Pyrinomonadaceae bacterium]|nr:M13 family metallopeptidase [Pyrinomonadaceae bacterium]